MDEVGGVESIATAGVAGGVGGDRAVAGDRASTGDRASVRADVSGDCESTVESGCLPGDSMCTALDLSWLLGRAAQRIAAVVDSAATRHGVGMRAQLVLTALAGQGGRTQLALGAALHVDKTTLTTELDRLESCGLVRRRPDPHDRRVRIPEITDAGRQVQAEVDGAISRAMDQELTVFSQVERTAFEAALRRLIDRPPVKGSAHGGCGPCDPLS